MLASLERGAVKFTQALTIVGFAALLLLALATTADVVGRAAFATPIQGVGDLAAVIMAVVVASALPACFAERRNIGVELLGGALGATATRVLDALAHVASLIFITLLATQLVRYSIDIQQSGQTTWILRLPLAPWWWAAAGFACLTVPVQALVTLRALVTMATGGRTRASAPGATPDA